MKKVEELKNYGKPISDIQSGSESKKINNRMAWAIIGEMRRGLGLIGLIKLTLKLRKEINRGKAQDWSSLNEHGITNRKFLDSLIFITAAGKALSDIVGRDKASDIFRRAYEQTSDILPTTWPSFEDFKGCGDAIEAFREYTKAFIAAEVQAGLHEMELVEDSPKAMAINVKYCTWCEVAKKLGDPYLCYFTFCAGDDILFTKPIASAGGRFTRTGTLATGAPVCDFRFELVSKTD